MTMQIGIVAKDGIVLASDMQHEVTERRTSNDPRSVLSEPLIYSKLTRCKNHQIVIALAGWSAVDKDPSVELANHLDGLPEISDEKQFGLALQSWGDEFYLRSPARDYQLSAPLCSFLVASPQTSYPLWRLEVNRCSVPRPSGGYITNGHDNNSAIFWPRYFEVHKSALDMAATTTIAALTVLMAAELNPHGIGTLEIWRYRKGWEAVPDEEIKAIKKRLIRMQQTIKTAILLRSRRSR